MIDWRILEVDGAQVAVATSRPFGRTVVVLKNPPVALVLEEITNIEEAVREYLEREVPRGERPDPTAA